MPKEGGVVMTNKPSLAPDFKPIAYRSRKRMVIPNPSRNWYRNPFWYWTAFEDMCNPAIVTVDPEVAKPLTEEERQAHMRRMLDAKM